MVEKEQQTEKKKRGLFRRIFKWIGLGLLVLLLIASIIFQAPWKVITLLAIILAACTILPKPFRKRFWLSAAAIVVALIIWVLLPEDDEGWRPYTFDEELAALEAKHAIPDEENAAIIYNTLLENYDPNAFYVNLPDDERWKLPMREPWLSKDHPQIAEWLQQHQTTITTLTKASKFEKCHFPILLDTGPNSKWMRRLSVARRWAWLLISAASNDFAENRIDEALEKHITTQQIGKHQCQQPAKLDALVGIAIEAIAIGQINRFIVTRDATAEHLRIIEESLAKIKYDWSCDFPRILESEKLFSKRLLGWFYEINLKGKIRLNRDPWAEWIDSWKEHYEKKQMEEQQIREQLKAYGYLTYWQRKTIRVQTLLRWFILPSNPKKAGKVIDNIFEKYYAMAKPDFDWQKEAKETPVLVIPSPSVWPNLNQSRTIEDLADISGKTYHYHRLHDIYLRHVSNQKGCQILIALRRYRNKNGNWPESLDEIKLFTLEEIFVDPISRNSFMYKLTDDNFKLYSKGKNNIDEDGKRDRRGDQKTDADDWLIWPKRSRKDERKDTNAK